MDGRGRFWRMATATNFLEHQTFEKESGEKSCYQRIIEFDLRIDRDCSCWLSDKKQPTNVTEWKKKIFTTFTRFRDDSFICCHGS